MSDTKFPVGPTSGPYEFDYTILPPLAYAHGIHIEDLPTFKWIELVADQLARILLDEVEVKVEEDVEHAAKWFEELVAKIVRWLEHLVSRLVGRLRTGTLGSRPTRGTESEIRAVLDDLRAFGKTAEHPATIEEALALVERLTTVAEPARPPAERTLKQYDDLFLSLPIPEIADHLQSDKFFAELRVAGFNPLMLTRMDTVPDNFRITDEAFRAAPGFEHDSLAAAMGEGRLYIADYGALDVLQPGETPAHKFVYTPIALFGVPAGNPPKNPLAPIAIQTGQDPGSDALFGPGDGDDWEKAKTCVQSSDGNYHELVSHLGRTHLLVEPFVVATHRNLEPSHPIAKLLMPHFEGTIFINGLAVDFLVNPGGPVDQLLQGTIQSDLKLTVQGLLDVDFNHSWLPTWMKDRGLDDTDKLPYYPYRDDGLLLWNAIHEWCTGYVDATYASDEDMQQDEALAKWAADIVDYDTGGRVTGFGEPGLKTRAYLAGALTMLVFTASAAHAAVNFPQSSIMSYTPGVPLAGYQPPPGGSGPEYEWIDMLPDLKMANLQLVVLYLLGGVHYTQLGHYSPGHFTEPRIVELAATFQRLLATVEADIEKRNRERTGLGLSAYPYLLPSKIPQSINI